MSDDLTGLTIQELRARLSTARALEYQDTDLARAADDAVWGELQRRDAAAAEAYRVVGVLSAEREALRLYVDYLTRIIDAHNDVSDSIIDYREYDNP